MHVASLHPCQISLVMLLSIPLITQGCIVQTQSSLAQTDAHVQVITIDGGVDVIDGGASVAVIDGGHRFIDGGQQYVDGGVAYSDGGEQPIDGGIQYIDGGVQTTDGGTQHVDGGVQVTDGGTHYIDGGVQITDGGTHYIDGGVQITDGGTHYIDGGVQTIDGGVPPIDAGPAATWVQRSSGTTATLLGVASSGSTLVAVGFGGTALWSNDGLTWAPASPALPSNNDYYAVAYGLVGGNGTMVAVGTNMRGTNNGGIISTSDDARTWTARTPATNLGLTGVTYGNGVFVVVGNSGTIQWSADAVTWTSASGASSHLGGVDFVNGRFVAMGQGGEFLHSMDGQSWTAGNTGSTGTYFRPVYAYGHYIAVGYTASSATAISSPMLSAWTETPIIGSSNFYNVAAGPVLAATSTEGIWVSPDGVAWSLELANPTLGGSIVWTGTQFVAVGGGGQVYTR
jgi:hypothetical protein